VLQQALRLTLGAMRRPPGILNLIPGALKLAKSCKNRPHQTPSFRSLFVSARLRQRTDRRGLQKPTPLPRDALECIG
jgi:hypothetical protein